MDMIGKTKYYQGDRNPLTYKQMSVNNRFLERGGKEQKESKQWELSFKRKNKNAGKWGETEGGRRIHEGRGGLSKKKSLKKKKE